ncbi:hypothetical protein K431DRAFT_208865, partial [Polychaeton citri CBS 116435]
VSLRHDSAASAASQDWMYQTQAQSMGGSLGPRSGFKRQRSHQRTPSASTIGSTGPASPYTQNIAYPQIATGEVSPNSPLHYPEQPQQAFSKNLSASAQPSAPVEAYNSNYLTAGIDLSNAHLAMKDFAIDHHNQDGYTPDFTHSRQSMSSKASPATPHSGGTRGVDCLHRGAGFHQSNPSLIRTESAAFQDELYNPANFSTTAPAPPVSRPRPSQQYLSPHRNLVQDRLQTANLARSGSPTSAASRDRSPFRQGSPLAPMDGWSSPRGTVGTAAGMRQQQKEEAEQAEYAHHRPQLQREPTKTISPKDAVLDYNGADEPSLFQDGVPTGYKQHFGSAEQYGSALFSQPGATFGPMHVPTNNPDITNFRAATGPEGFASSNFDFSPLPALRSQQPQQHQQHQHQQHQQIPHNPFSTNNYQPVTNMNSNMNSYQPSPMNEAAPEFPAHLTSMESSMSENGPGPSSQESAMLGQPQRPADVRANTGTYTCTYHGCAQRFDSHNNLQKHKRDFHRSQAQANRSAFSTNDNSGTSTGTASVSPRSSESPAPGSSAGMTSAALQARNSQAGPHKCNRINPSTNKPCNTIFSRPYDLTRHEDTIHNNRKQKVRCSMCREEKTFSRNDALTRHMRVVHPEVEQFGKRGRRSE